MSGDPELEQINRRTTEREREHWVADLHGTVARGVRPLSPRTRQQLQSAAIERNRRALGIGTQPTQGAAPGQTPANKRAWGAALEPRGPGGGPAL